MDLVRVHLSTSSPGLFPQKIEGKALGTRLVHQSIHFYLFGLIITAIIFNSLLLSEPKVINGEDETCDVSKTPIGCYNENPKKPALPKVFYNEADPGKPNFGGSLLQWSNYFKADFKKFVCKCARLAKSYRWGYFGVRETGRSKATDHEYWVCTRENREIREFYATTTATTTRTATRLFHLV